MILTNIFKTIIKKYINNFYNVDRKEIEKVIIDVRIDNFICDAMVV